MSLDLFVFQFMEFVKAMLKALNLLDEQGVSKASPDILLDHDPSESIHQYMPKFWSIRAPDWPAIESAGNYSVTFRTLLDHMRATPGAKKEKILSLGAGPGLYEIFLAHLLSQSFQGIRFTITDYAPGMTELCRKILDHAGMYLKYRPNVSIATEDMTKLNRESGSIDQVICNNALQWTTEWQKALSEVRRVLKPDGLGKFYLIVHPYPMRIRDEGGAVDVTFADFKIPELLDTLESQRFTVVNTRIITGTRGTGQFGAATERLFINARLTPGGTKSPWRNSPHAPQLMKYYEKK